MDQGKTDIYVDKRRQSRKTPVNYIEVYNADTEEFFGSLADLNVGGLRLLAPRELNRDRSYPLRLRLPRSIGEADEIHFTAACRWQTACSNALLEGSYHAGLEIVDLTPLDADLLSNLLTSAWFRDWRQLPDYDRIRRETGYPEE